MRTGSQALRGRLRPGSLLKTVATAVSAVALLAAGPVGAAQASSWGTTAAAGAEDALSALLQAVDTTTSFADRSGGYRLERTVDYFDGGRLVTNAKYEANGSVEFRELYTPGSSSGGLASSVNYIWDAVARSFAFPRPQNDEARNAYAVLGAPDDAWLVKSLRSFNGATMKSPDGKAGFFLGAYLYESVVTSGRVESPQRIVADVRDYAGDEYRLVVTLGSSGELTQMDYVGKDGTKLTMRMFYGPEQVEQPTGTSAVAYKSFEKALQSLNLENRLWSIAYETRSTSIPSTPASIRSAAKAAIAKAKRLGLLIPVKIQSLKLGARLQVTNPFTKQKFAFSVVAKPPYPDSAPEILTS